MRKLWISRNRVQYVECKYTKCNCMCVFVVLNFEKLLHGVFGSSLYVRILKESIQERSMTGRDNDRGLSSWR